MKKLNTLIHYFFIAEENFDGKEEQRMKGFVGKKMGIIFVALMLLSLYAQTSLALDNLSLTGFVRSIDKTNGTINLEITSESCRGFRVFRMPGKINLDDSRIGEKLEFKIDSSKCERGKIYNILSGEKP